MLPTLVLVISNSGLIIGSIIKINERRNRQVQLAVRHRFTGLNYYMTHALQQLIYDGIIIKSGLRNDISLEKHLLKIETSLAAFGKNILYAKSLYDNNFDYEENDAF